MRSKPIALILEGVMRGSRSLSVLAVSVLAAGACSPTVELEGKACGADGSCPAPLSCATATNTCQTLGAGNFAADWTSSMVALYQFDDPMDLGRDSGPAGRHLTIVGTPTAGRDAPRGVGHASIEAGSHFEVVSTAFGSPPNASFTFGGWFRVTDIAPREPRLLSRIAGNLGYELTREATPAAVICYAGTGIHSNATETLDVWFHAVCRYDPFLGYITHVHEGQSENDDNGSPVHTDDVGDAGDEVPFRISSAEDPLHGDVDEVFFVNRDLDTASINRIYACGVDGRNCTCDAADPASYVSCAPAKVCARDLPPCDQATPSFKTML